MTSAQSQYQRPPPPERAAAFIVNTGAVCLQFLPHRCQFPLREQRAERKFTAHSAHTAGMKLTTVLCCAWLIFFGLCAAVWSLTGFDLLAAVTFGNAVAYRALLSLAGVGALWLLFWLIAFRPTRQLR